MNEIGIIFLVLIKIEKQALKKPQTLMQKCMFPCQPPPISPHCVCGLGGCRFHFLIKAVMDGDDKAHQSSAADSFLVSSTFSPELAPDLLPREGRIISSASLSLGESGCHSSLWKCLAGLVPT